MKVNRDTLGEDLPDLNGLLLRKPRAVTLDLEDWGTVKAGLLMAAVGASERRLVFLGRAIDRVNDLIRKQIDGELML